MQHTRWILPIKFRWRSLIHFSMKPVTRFVGLLSVLSDIWLECILYLNIFLYSLYIHCTRVFSKHHIVVCHRVTVTNHCEPRDHIWNQNHFWYQNQCQSLAKNGTSCTFIVCFRFLFIYICVYCKTDFYTVAKR